MEHYSMYMDSPLGPLYLRANEEAMLEILFDPPADAMVVPNAVLYDCAAQLQAYFERRLQIFQLAMAPSGTPFQQLVWQALDEVPYGVQISYASLARRMQQPLAIRAIAQALGRNPLPLIRPCHRIIGGDGSWVGFAGGKARKIWLLEHEGGSLF